MEEGIELNKNGTVTLVLDKTEILLRRPTVGEMIDFEEGLSRVAEKEAPLRLPEKNAKGKYVDETPEERRARRLKVVSFYLDWTREVVKVLGRDELSDKPMEDLPSWLLDPSLCVDLAKHWRTRPLAPGKKEDQEPRAPLRALG